jgi:ERCC4-type nuclease
MFIKLDNREHELYKKLQQCIDFSPKYKDIKIHIESLPLGDIIFNDGIQDLVIIERKTWKDLAASIKDGRYEEQSYRLNGLTFPNHNIIYLIEGDITKYNCFKDRLDKSTLYSALFSILYFKGFSILQSNSIDESAYLLCCMLCKLVNGLKQNKQAFYINNTFINNNTTTCSNDKNTNGIIESTVEPHVVPSDKDYTHVVKKVKKENITTDNIGEIMLCQLPGISSTSAIAILSNFKTLPNLIQQLQQNIKCLDNIYTTDSKGKQRKLNKNVILTIQTYLIN